MIICALAALLPLAGCKWLRHILRGPASGASSAAVTPTPTPAPYLPPSIERTLQTPTSGTAQLADGPRLQSPESLGSGARQKVGRTFEPLPFDAGSTELNAEARRRLMEYAAWFRAHPRVWAVLAGNTDPDGAGRFNLNIGMARAIAAHDFLKNQQLDPRKFFPISYGAELGNGDSVDIMAFVAPEGVELPPPDESDSAAPAQEEPANDAPEPEEF